MFTVLLILYISAFIAAIIAAVGPCPLWVSVILLSIAGLVQVLPLK